MCDEGGPTSNRPCGAPGKVGSAFSGHWVDQNGAILSRGISAKTPLNSPYFFFGVKDDSRGRLAAGGRRFVSSCSLEAGYTYYIAPSSFGVWGRSCGVDSIYRRSTLHRLFICRRKTAASAVRGVRKPQKILWKRIQNEIAVTGRENFSSRPFSSLWTGPVMEHFYPDQVTAC
jgi:hypothetical protein